MADDHSGKSLPTAKKSPLETRPLRYPGQGLDEEINDLVQDRVAETVAFVAMAVMGAAASWVVYLWPNPFFVVELTLVACCIVIWAIWRLRRVRRHLAQLRLGRDGERKVGQYLEYLRADGYRIYHDIEDKNGNTDHVVIGPAGVFTVETKTLSKPARGDARVIYDGTSILVDGRSLDRDPLPQAKAQARSLNGLIRDLTGKSFQVRPVVVFPGWMVDAPSSGQFDVIVRNPKQLPGFFKQSPQKLAAEDVKLISNQLDRELRRRAEAEVG